MTDVTTVLEGLNEQQREAVVASPGPLLITAGAGSGKTTAITRRIAWLIEANGVSPHQILAVTFTNKAAREMKARVEQLLGTNAAPGGIATFHGFSCRFLRIYHEAARLPRDFTILDQDDQKSFINRLINDSQLRIGKWNAKDVQSYINGKKERQLRASKTHEPSSRREEIMGPIYELYEHECNIRGLVDFAEILLRTVEVMQRNELVRSEIHERYQHILVDEFQDTNAIQIEWLKLFSNHLNYITAVGDEDQSIYGWRGAVAKNMLSFTSLFPNTRLIRLEKNYRSTQTILTAANSVIARNSDRFEKKLWTDQDSGEPIGFFTASDHQDESWFVAEKAKALHEAGFAYSDMTILYRTHAQSNIFETTLSSYRIPFRIYGGVRFFLRMEIKHALAYLRLIVDPDNGPAFQRVINVPPRGIGEVAQRRVFEVARHEDISLMQAARIIANDGSEQSRIKTPLGEFIELIERMETDCSGFGLTETIKHVNAHSGLRDLYLLRDTEIDKPRVENLDELINAGANFIQMNIDHGTSGESAADGREAIILFLDTVALDAGDTFDETSDTLSLMTLHQAKGLEFPVVFLVGMDEKLLPHANALEYGRVRRTFDQVEEERRLCYVGMTRAKKQLYLTRAKLRMYFGHLTPYVPSRFINEIPKQCIRKVTPDFAAGQSDSDTSVATLDLEEELEDLRGRRVRHKKFGEGTVTDITVGQGHTIVQIRFEDVGEKLLLLEQAGLEFLDN
ncbi:MAG: UvrD-helicase domain-containing protein [Acidiferrobacterales bacterium]|nr:UvrD-helicase domain-containing protein [Acidiferrobacterales bacterium]